MNDTQTQRSYEIDAKGKRLGRLASHIAVILMGKDTPEYVRNQNPNVKVEVKNVGKMLIYEKKKNMKEYTRYTGYPGGLRKEKMANLIERKGTSEALKKAVYGMLPNNKLRPRMMKNLILQD